MKEFDSVIISAFSLFTFVVIKCLSRELDFPWIHCYWVTIIGEVNKIGENHNGTNQHATLMDDSAAIKTDCNVFVAAP